MNTNNTDFTHNIVIPDEADYPEEVDDAPVIDKTNDIDADGLAPEPVEAVATDPETETETGPQSNEENVNE